MQIEQPTRRRLKRNDALVNSDKNDTPLHSNTPKNGAGSNNGNLAQNENHPNSSTSTKRVVNQEDTANHIDDKKVRDLNVADKEFNSKMSGRSSYVMSSNTFGQQFQQRGAQPQPNGHQPSSFYGNLFNSAMGGAPSNNYHKNSNGSNNIHKSSSSYNQHQNGNRDLERQRNQAFAPAAQQSHNGHSVGANSRKRTYQDVMRDYHEDQQKSSKQQNHNTTGNGNGNRNQQKPVEHIQKSQRRVRRNNHGTDEQAEASGMEDDVGGSSQDKYESDFINDDGREEIEANKARKLKKGQLDSDDEDKFINSARLSAQQSITKKSNKVIEESEPEPEEDPYEKLTLAQGQEEGGFRYDPSDKTYMLTNYFGLPAKIYERLFEHQKKGVAWLYNLYKNKKGGVLGDDMGLGKTVQVATLCKGLFEGEHISKVLIVVPATMKMYWQGELGKWCPNVDNIMQFDDKKKQNREQQMRTLRKKGGILVTSYGMVTTEKINLSEMRYDLVVVDEGHKAKNINTELRRSLVALRCKGIRLVLSGTPLQNNLSELWSIFDFVQPKIFGPFQPFQLKFAEVIQKGLLKDSSKSEKAKADVLSRQLRQMYESHFLRRTKDQIFKIVCAETIGRPLKLNELPLKTDLVVWLPLSATQKLIYTYLIQNQDLQQIVQDRAIKNAFFILSYIKKLCLHPQLLSATTADKKRNLGLLSPEEEAAFQAQDDLEESQKTQVHMRTRKTNKQENKKTKKMCQALTKAENSRVKTRIEGELADMPKLEVDEDFQDGVGKGQKKGKGKDKTEEEQKAAEEKANSLFHKFGLAQKLQDIEDEERDDNFAKIIENSSKLQFLFKLLANFRKEGKRVLIFSMSKKMLTVIENIIQKGYFGNGKVKYMRIDGDTEICLREQMCVDFNKDASVFCALLTTKVGGQGLNLTGADRAIILDPDWNPANDNQAVDRIFRIGQKKDVIVYRLVTMGTIEEKIYRRQIYKKGMSLATIDATGQEGGQKDFEKYFKNTDLFELFQFDPETCNTTCDTLKLLLERDGFPFEETPTNLRHISFLREINDLVKGITLNTHLYTNKGTGQEEEESSDVELLPKLAESDVEESNDPSVASVSSSYGRGNQRKPYTAFTRNSNNYQESRNYTANRAMKQKSEKQDTEQAAVAQLMSSKFDNLSYNGSNAVAEEDDLDFQEITRKVGVQKNQSNMPTMRSNASRLNNLLSVNNKSKPSAETNSYSTLDLNSKPLTRSSNQNPIEIQKTNLQMSTSTSLISGTAPSPLVTQKPEPAAASSLSTMSYQPGLIHKPATTNSTISPVQQQQTKTQTQTQLQVVSKPISSQPGKSEADLLFKKYMCSVGTSKSSASRFKKTFNSLDQNQK